MKRADVVSRVDIRKFLNSTRGENLRSNELFDKSIYDPILETFIHACKIVDSMTFRLSREIRRMLENVLNDRFESLYEQRRK